MSIVNKICKEVYPSTPEVNPNQSVTVYVPVATDSILGIAKFYSDHFVVIDGQVKLRGAWESILTAISDATDAKKAASEAAEAAGAASEASATFAQNAEDAANSAKSIKDEVVTKYNDISAFASDALASKNAAETAQTKAETAQTKAEIARDEAENARDVAVAELSRVANAVKGTKRGTVITLDDVSPITHELTVKVRSKNLIPYPYAETTITRNGITFTDNGDGSITVNGTASTATSFYLTFNKAIKLSAGTYTISGGKSGVIVLARRNNTSWISSENGNTQTSTFNSNDVFDYFGLYVATGTTVDNVTIYPMFELGSTATAYVPYISDLTAVTVSKLGKNLIPYPYVDTTKTLNGITITDNRDGSIDLNGTSTGQVNFYFSQNLKFKKGVTYTLSASGNYSFSGTASFYIYNSTYGALAYINLGVDNSYTFTPREDINGINCYIVIPSDRTLSGTFKPQLELGSTATDYEEYIAPTEYIPKANGTVDGVESMYPNITLTTDTNGVVIDCEYNRDINKVFEELRQAILSLGGNI